MIGKVSEFVQILSNLSKFIQVYMQANKLYAEHQYLFKLTNII